MPNLRMAGLNSHPAFGVLPACYVFPHYDAMPVVFKPMVMALRRTLKEGQYLLGIEENTALVGKIGGEWRVLGEGSVHVVRDHGQKAYSQGEFVPL